MLSGVFERLILPLNLLEKPCQKNFKSRIQIFQISINLYICFFDELFRTRKFLLKPPCSGVYLEPSRMPAMKPFLRR